MSRIAVRHSWILKFPHFYFKTNVQYAHSFESSSQPFFSVCTNSDRKSKQYSWYCQTFSDVFYPEGQKRHWTLPLPREKYFHISIPWQQFNALFLYTFPYEKVNNQLRLSLSYCPFSRIHREITERWLHLIHAILGTHQLCRHSHKADAAILLLYGVLSKRSIHNNMVLGVLNLTIPIINEIIIFFIPYYILKGYTSFSSFYDFFHHFPITITKVRRLFLSAKYPNLACMKYRSECTKWQRGCAISLDNSWRITVGLRMHITCCASAYQLICKRTTAVVRPEILTNSKTYTILSNNLYYVFQQHISNIPTNKKGWIINLWHTLLAKSDTHNRW